MSKRVSVFFVLVMIAASLIAVSQKPLFEVFTSSTCTGCNYGNQVLDDVLNNNPDQYSLIKYQVNWPGNGDPYYIDATGTRRTYYGVSGVPSLFSNGEQDDIFEFDQQQFDTFQNQVTGMEISVLASIDENNVVTIETSLIAEEAYEAGLKLYITVVEKITVGNVGSNYETEFHNVIMAMLPNGNGTTLDAFTIGQQMDIVQSIDMNSTFMEQPNDLRVIVFVQDDTDSQIIQSEMVDVTGTFNDYELTFNINDSDGNPVEEAELFLEEYGTKISNEAGQIFYEGIFPGNYNYDIIRTGLFPFSGAVEIIDQDVIVDVIMEIPGDYFYEDFGSGIPTDWTVHVIYPDYLYEAGGRVYFMRQGNPENPILLVSPEIDLTPANTLFFEVGEQSGYPGNYAEIAWGFVSDPNDPSTFVIQETFEPGFPMEEYSFDISAVAGNSYIGWAYAGNSSGCFFSLDNIRLVGTGGPVLEPPASIDTEIENYNSVNITWEAPIINRDLLGYKVYKDAVELIEITDPATLTYTDEELDAGVYAYSVSAIYDEGESEQIFDGITIYLYPPTDLIVELIDQAVMLSWNAPPASRGIDEYKIYIDEVETGTTTETYFEYTETLTPGTHEAGVSVVYSGGFESELLTEEFEYTSADDLLVFSLPQLCQNYPNPFNPTTTIEFSIYKDSRVELTIFNIKGQKIKTLIHNEFTKGSHSVIWNGTDFNNNPVSSGIYFYKLNSGRYISTKKMILMK